MNAWTDGWMDVWMYGCMDAWMYVCMYVHMCIHTEIKSQLRVLICVIYIYIY